MPRLHAPSKDDSRLLPPFAALPERCIHVPATDAEFAAARAALMAAPVLGFDTESRSEEHTSELQSQSNLVCRLLLEKKKKKQASNKSDFLSVRLKHAMHNIC